MSALGDYIHLHSENYIKYGTTRRGAYDAISSYENYVKSRLSKIKEINKSTLDVFKNRLKGEADGIITKDAVAAEKRFQENIDKIYEAVAQKTTQGLIGRYVGTSVWKPTDYQNIKGVALSKGEIEKKRALIGIIYKLINKIEIEGTSGNASQEDIKQLVQSYNSLTGKNLKGTQSSLGIVQEDIDNYAYYNGISNIAGDFGEMLVAATQDVANGQSVEVVNNTIEGVVGNLRSGGSFSKAEIAKDLSNYGLRTDASGNEYLVQRTQDKVDVQIKVNQEDIFATVKNYYKPSKVTLQAQTSLFDALVALQREGNFGNHYLNAHAGRLTRTKDAIIVDEAVRFELAYDALVGGNPLKEGAAQANVFVVFDRHSGNVIVKQTKDILTNELDRIIKKPSVQNIKFRNRMSKKIQDRIANILVQAHQTNLHVSYNINANDF